MAAGTTGDAASPAAISRLSKVLSGDRTSVKAQRKAIETLKSALAAVRTGDFAGGARRASQVVQIDPGNGLAWHVLAICHEKAGHLAEALGDYEQALKCSPEDANIAHDLGRLAHHLGHLEIAEKLILKFLTAEPGHIEGTNNLACVLRDQKRYGEAITLLRDQLSIDPAEPSLWNTLGTVLTDQGQIAPSLTFFDEALRLDPAMAKARYNRANARQSMFDPEGALEDIDAALPGAESPYEAAMMTMARALTLMGMGRLTEGFETYEIRLAPQLPEAVRFVADAPRWDPKTQDLNGKRLLIIGEQGIADELVFGGCIPDAIEAVGPEGQVFLAVDPRFVSLFQRSFPTAIVGPHKAVRLDSRLIRYIPFMEELTEKADFWTPLASLCAVYRHQISDFPDREGYLTPDPAKVAHWKAELEKLGPGCKVGLHWKSSLLTGVRARYFSDFERWAPVLTAPGCVMVNLQCGDVSDDLAAAEAAGAKIWTPPIDLKNDLEDLIALSSALDLVVGPGIAGTNMAAATGARTWLIHAPDDWHLMGTDHYPFYPRVRTFATGGFDGWPRVIEDIRVALAAEVSARP